MYALEPAPPSGPLGNSSVEATEAQGQPPTPGHLEAMASNLYNLDSVSISGYSHPSSHSPYANPAAHGLLLPSSANYHHHPHLDLNPGLNHHHLNHSMALDATEAQQRISVSSAG